MECQNISREIPKIVEECCESVLVLQGSSTEGIFRISCRSDELETAMQSAKKSVYNFERFNSPHVPAVLLKTFLKAMGDPLVPKAVTLKCQEFGDLVGKDGKRGHDGEFDKIWKKVQKGFGL